MKIDLNEIKEFLGCDDAFLTYLFGKFVQESGEGIGILKKASVSGNWPLAKSAAHKMLSSTRMFNFEELSLLLEEIESSVDEGKNTDEIPDKVDSIEGALKNAVGEMQALLRQSQP